MSHSCLCLTSKKMIFLYLFSCYQLNIWIIPLVFFKIRNLWPLQLFCGYNQVFLLPHLGEMWGKENYSQEHQRAGFVDALLSNEKVDSIIKADGANSALHEKIQMPHIVEATTGTDLNGMNRNMLAVSLLLKKEQQRKKEIIKYKVTRILDFD
ncbi:uncharacterized protein LOC142543189 isoform X2 [Primulina tabacum]|uniref:uncharacterized protein LOC142543189 isoform X2 n=1 Tax=Primulina tabacum TaxID=48773 RepID=UPI003F5AB222